MGSNIDSAARLYSDTVVVPEEASILPEKNRAELENFLRLHRELFGVEDHVKALMNAEPNLYGPGGLTVGPFPTRELVGQYFDALQRALFLSAKEVRLGGYSDKETISEKKRVEQIARASHLKREEQVSAKRLQMLITFFKEILHKAERRNPRNHVSLSTPLNMLAGLVPLLTPSLNERRRRMDMLEVSEIRAREVFEFVTKEYAQQPSRGSSIGKRLAAWGVHSNSSLHNSNSSQRQLL